MVEFFMLLGELGLSDQFLSKSFWIIGITATVVLLLIRRQQIKPTIVRAIEKCHESKIRGCLIFAPFCAVSGAIVYYLVMPFCLSEAGIARSMEEPSLTAQKWIFGYLTVYGCFVLAPLMTLWQNKPKIAFVPEYLLPLLVYMFVPPLGFYSILALVLSADIRSLWFIFMPMFQWMLCLIPYLILRWQNVIE